jgi:pyrimidine operon attenuation protein/uracil phosphoribosyltransferase
MPDSSGISELADCQSLLDKLEQRLRQEIEQRQLTDPIMIGIHSGGVWIAKELHRRLGISEPLGKLDITFYRDDFSQIGMHPQVQASQLPFTLEGRDILLIDDVFYTGRTIRAALNEIFDYGRPSQVLLGVLIERDGREIPLRPDCTGGTLTLPAGQRIKLTGPAPLALSVHTLREAA